MSEHGGRGAQTARVWTTRLCHRLALVYWWFWGMLLVTFALLFFLVFFLGFLGFHPFTPSTEIIQPHP
jgi:hypothetical protein